MAGLPPCRMIPPPYVARFYGGTELQEPAAELVTEEPLKMFAKQPAQGKTGEKAEFTSSKYAFESVLNAAMATQVIFQRFPTYCSWPNNYCAMQSISLLARNTKSTLFIGLTQKVAITHAGI